MLTLSYFHLANWIMLHFNQVGRQLLLLGFYFFRHFIQLAISLVNVKKRERERESESGSGEIFGKFCHIINIFQYFQFA